MNKGSAKIAVSITACLCLTFLLLGLYSGRLTSLKRGEWTGLQDTDETIQSWGGKGQVHINNQQYDIEGRAIRQGGDKGSIKVEAGWHKPHEKMPMAHVTADLKVKNDSQQKTKQQETNNNDDSPPGCYKNKPDHFSLSRLVESFKNTLTKDGEIDTTKYIDTNNELMKFFPMMGTLFTFVTSEAQNKIDYLMSYLEGPDGKEYKTLSSMVKFETDNHIINIKAYEESGTRNFLRLHRGLNFSLAFCEGLKNSKPGDNIVTIAYDSYSSTVSHFHGWFVRKAIQAAFYLLPSRDTFMGLLCDTDEDTAFKLLNELAEVAKPVYDRTQYVYEKYNYLDLP
ncbi:CPTP [Branchiostoma lanceolatum]|uniref:CPTP protein n=1 Tax=Branchiostoma lanceolatum TaxID=7740 RepID=A0A8J9W8B8_BRALA|nr:CPTP [Branchiostoma lanceolatum]